MNLSGVIATFFGAGKFKYAPGTFASFLTAILIFPMTFLKFNGHLIIFLAILTLIIGIITSGIEENRSGEKDPKIIVIDEVCGMLISCSFIAFYPLSIIERVTFIAVAFGFFRFFDITKPFPVRIMEKIKGGAGIMLDDVNAGIIANLCSRVIFFLVFKRELFF